MASDAPLILVIDDEEAMRDSCSQILVRNGWRAETAEDGTAGLAKARDLRPAAVIVDLKMPGLSGFEVLRQLPEIDPAIVAIVITGYATIDSAVEAMKAGAFDFLPKPFTPEEMRIVLGRALDRRRLALEAEALRKEKKALEENFVTLVSHQLRSPLGAIQQYFEVILAGLAGQPEARWMDMIRKASARVRGLLALINDWLDLSRIDRIGLVDKLVPLDPAPILDRLIEFYAPAAKEAGVTVGWAEGRPAAPVTIWGDEASLEQAFSNLLSNAVKFNRPGGRVEVRLSAEPGGAAIEIRDTGIGIAPEHLPRLFEQFFQVAPKEGGVRKGTGLGLALVKKIVEAHGGRIDVASEIGAGSVFTVRLPAESPGAAA
jgi:two-component system sensor histidine kinase/response regulator